MSSLLNKYKLKTTAGFSLAEILIAIAIIALTATISIPLFRTVSLTLSLNAAGRDVATDLRYAQQLAVTTQDNHKIIFDMIGNSYIISNNISGEIIKSRQIKSPITISSIADLANNTVIFNATGAASSIGTIILANPNNRLITISIKPSGYVKVN